MEDLLAALFTGVVEVLIEALGELLCSLVINGLYRCLVRWMGRRRGSVLAKGLSILLAGAICGAISVWLIPHPLVHRSRLHGISLIASPLLVGVATWQIGRLFRDAEDADTPVQYFWGGAAFAFAMAVVRFVWVG